MPGDSARTAISFSWRTEYSMSCSAAGLLPKVSARPIRSAAPSTPAETIATGAPRGT